MNILMRLKEIKIEKERREKKLETNMVSNLVSASSDITIPLWINEISYSKTWTIWVDRYDLCGYDSQYLVNIEQISFAIFRPIIFK
jgi:hypothetical protein